MSQLSIGTSGWVYKHWKGIFYPQDLAQTKWLDYFSQQFKTVEVNSTFYHLIKPQTFQKWYETVPKDFLFTVKGSRFLTHIKRLGECEEPLDNFAQTVMYLKDKMGPVLWQLPPRWKYNGQILEDFFGCLKKSKLKKARHAFEFRDISWFNDDCYNLLTKNNAALVIAESGDRWPCIEKITADFTFLRFHGQNYSSDYSNKELKDWAGKIKKWKRKGDIYAYFNNDVSGFAVENAKTLKNLVQG